MTSLPYEKLGRHCPGLRTMYASQVEPTISRPDIIFLVLQVESIYAATSHS
ncbi:hypothetical protein GLYMA_02G021300v4 [Glycine max]|uniref:Uncharacterized protein n=1 Tax=Glycine max TaxID=3847 RepID=K7K603_SOYBN|nr:hypothetical protein GYH30_002770 [Glycine max]KRH69354.1 hypothetical protein GLYMA_02G021300v4 [Glycine max]